MTMTKTLFVSTAILSLVAVSSCGSNPSNGDAGAGAGGKGGTTGVGGQAGTSAGGRGGGGAGATGTGGGVARRRRGRDGGGGEARPPCRGGVRRRCSGGVGGGDGTGGGGGRGGSGGVAGNGAGGRGGMGGSAGNAGRGGMGGGGGGESCGGQICGQDEFCCGPPACGNCRNILTGPNCPTSCGGSGGNAGRGGSGGAGGTSGAACPAVPPQPGGNCTVGLNCYYEDCAGRGPHRRVLRGRQHRGTQVAGRHRRVHSRHLPQPVFPHVPGGSALLHQRGWRGARDVRDQQLRHVTNLLQLPAVLQRGLLGARIRADRNHRLLQHVPAGRMPLSPRRDVPVPSGARSRSFLHESRRLFCGRPRHQLLRSRAVRRLPRLRHGAL